MRYLLAVALACCLSTPATAEVVAQSDAGFVVRETAEVAADPAQTWMMLISPQKWWNKEHTFSGDSVNLYLDAQGGGCFCEKLPLKPGAPGTRGGSVAHMRVVYADPGRALRMEGALGPLQSEALNGSMTITLRPSGEGTKVVLEYVVGGYMRYKADEIVPAVDKVLAEQLAGLAAALGTAPGGDPDTKEAKGKTGTKPASKP